MKDDVLCFYHANCVDGAASAAVILHKYPKAQCVPVTHGDPVKVSVKGKILFIVDFSFNAETLEKFRHEAKEVRWYDHHITSVPIHEKLHWGIIDLKESGASLTWKQEFPRKPLPKILEFVRDKDLYTWKLKHSREVSMDLANQAGITNPKSPFWQKWLKAWNKKEWKQRIDRGAQALASQRQRILSGLRYGFEVNFHGHKTLAVNWSLEASDIGEVIYKELDYSVALLFYFNGENWTFSLRSNKVDVSQLALKHEGGGHPGAAGFRSQEIDWLMKIKKAGVPPFRAEAKKK